MRLTFNESYIHRPDVEHSGVMGTRWGVRRYQNSDGSLTAAGRKRYLNSDGTFNKRGRKFKAKTTEKELNKASYERANAQAKLTMHENRMKYAEHKSRTTTDRWKIPKYKNDVAIAKIKMREMEMHIQKADRKIAAITDRITKDPDLTYHIMQHHNESSVTGTTKPKKDGYSLQTRLMTYNAGKPVAKYDNYNVVSTDSATGKMYKAFGTNTSKTNAKLRYK